MVDVKISAVSATAVATSGVAVVARRSAPAMPECSRTAVCLTSSVRFSEGICDKTFTAVYLGEAVCMSTSDQHTAAHVGRA